MNKFYPETCAPSNTYELREPVQSQLDLFADPARWPKKPWCAQDLEAGLRIRSLEHALRRPYIQANPPHLRVWSIFDVDRPGAALAWESANLPPPSWITINKQNAHAHLVYGLTVPVLVESAEARQAPIRYLVALEAAFRDRLQADSGYNGLITKNPAHPLWRTVRGPTAHYELSYLSEWVDLQKFIPRKGVKIEEIGLGRNITLFDFMRKWAYVAVRKERGMRNYVLWQARVYDRALERNADFLHPLSYKEAHHIAKSVTKWVWKTDPGAEQRFLARQAAKGTKGGVASGVSRLKASEEKRVSARLMAAAGASMRAIATELAVSVGSVHAWVAKGVQ